MSQISGEPSTDFTAEARRHGETQRSGDRVIGRSGDLNENLTAEARRHGERQRTDFSDHRITCDHPITRSVDALLHAWQIIIAALREIFDESAYDRFLLRTQSSRSGASYREFLREREAVVAQKPRCC